MGIRNTNSKKMTFQSCILTAKQNGAMPDKNNIPYKEFNKAYSNWRDMEYDSTVRSTPLRVRESICLHKEDFILSLYSDWIKNPDLRTAGYNHDQAELQNPLLAILRQNDA